MGLRLSVHRAKWREQVLAAAAVRPGLIPVVKGNGYGFGRTTLMPIAAAIGQRIAVGTVYEAGDVPANGVAMVLTPHLGRLPENLSPSTILTIGSIDHLAAVREQKWAGAVAIKLRSSMQRYGVAPDGLPGLLLAARTAGCEVVTFSLHFPLTGAPEHHLAEIEQWLPLLPHDIAIAVSHIDPGRYKTLCHSNPQRTFQIRCGTALWHAQRSSLALSTDVLDVHQVAAGLVVGYRGTTIPGNGALVLVAAGSAHGVAALPDGNSPYHFARQRLLLIEPPHMHTSMIFVPAGQQCPAVGDRVDVQHPLTQTTIDELDWIDD